MIIAFSISLTNSPAAVAPVPLVPSSQMVTMMSFDWPAGTLQTKLLEALVPVVGAADNAFLLVGSGSAKTVEETVELMVAKL